MRIGIMLGAVVVMAFSAVCASNDDPRVAVTPRETPRSRVQPAGTLRVDVKLILIPATVTDPYGAPFSGLPQAAFRLFEDGVEQELKYFSSDDAPISLGVVFDSSRSMEHKLNQSRAAVKQFFGVTGHRHHVPHHPQKEGKKEKLRQ